MLSFAGALRAIPGVIIRCLVRQIKGENSRGGDGPLERGTGGKRERGGGGGGEVTGESVGDEQRVTGAGILGWRHTALILSRPAAFQ